MINTDKFAKAVAARPPDAISPVFAFRRPAVPGEFTKKAARHARPYPARTRGLAEGIKTRQGEVQPFDIQMDGLRSREPGAVMRRPPIQH